MSHKIVSKYLYLNDNGDMQLLSEEQAFLIRLHSATDMTNLTTALGLTVHCYPEIGTPEHAKEAIHEYWQALVNQLDTSPVTLIYAKLALERESDATRDLSVHYE